MDIPPLYKSDELAERFNKEQRRKDDSIEGRALKEKGEEIVEHLEEKSLQDYMREIELEELDKEYERY